VGQDVVQVVGFMGKEVRRGVEAPWRWRGERAPNGRGKNGSGLASPDRTPAKDKYHVLFNQTKLEFRIISTLQFE
jgi:hypothetical protein